MNGLRVGIVGTSLLAALTMLGCEKGPAQKLGERIDRVTDQDKVIGKGPVEKAGKEIDQAVKK